MNHENDHVNLSVTPRSAPRRELLGLWNASPGLHHLLSLAPSVELGDRRDTNETILPCLFDAADHCVSFPRLERLQLTLPLFRFANLVTELLGSDAITATLFASLRSVHFIVLDEGRNHNADDEDPVPRGMFNSLIHLPSLTKFTHDVPSWNIDYSTWRYLCTLPLTHLTVNGYIETPPYSDLPAITTTWQHLIAPEVKGADNTPSGCRLIGEMLRQYVEGGESNGTLKHVELRVTSQQDIDVLRLSSLTSLALNLDIDFHHILYDLSILYAVALSTLSSSSSSVSATSSSAVAPRTLRAVVPRLEQLHLNTSDAHNFTKHTANEAISTLRQYVNILHDHSATLTDVVLQDVLVYDSCEPILHARKYVREWCER